MNDMQEIVETIMGEIMRTKADEFIEKFHQKRLNEFKIKHPEHYAQYTDEEMEFFEAKEKELVEDYFAESHPYTHKIPDGDILLIDGIPDSSIALIEQYSAELFEDCQNNYQLLKERMDTIYELTAEYFSLIKSGIDYKYTSTHYYNHFNEGKPERRLKDLRKKITDLKEISEVDIIDSPHHNKLKEALEDLYNEPEKYFTEKYNLLSPSLIKSYRQPLLEYLKSLNLKKGRKIDAFIEKLTESILSIYH